MHISFPDNINNLRNFYKKENIEEDIKLKGDIKLLNILASMVILKNIYNNILNKPPPANPQVTFIECVGMCFLLQTISNNLSRLPEQYKENEISKKIAEKIDLSYEQSTLDRFVMTHIVNLSGYYHQKNSMILEYINKRFFANELFQLITDYCTNLLIESKHTLNSPEITGEIGVVYKADQISSHVNELKLPLHNAQEQEQDLICKEDLYKLLCVNTILFNEILRNNKKLFYEDTFEAMVLVALVNQVHGNCLTSLLKPADNQEFQLIIEYLDPIIVLRNNTAHSGNLKSLEHVYKKVWDQYGKFDELLLLNNGQKRYYDIKKQLKIPTVKAKAKQKESRKKEQLFECDEELLKHFRELPEPAYAAPFLDSTSISYKIMEILKEPYNSKQPISTEDIAKIKELIDHPNFNPNISIRCEYKLPLPTVNEYEEDRSKLDNNLIIRIFENDEKKHIGEGDRFIKHRPIDILCQIANPKDKSIELVQSMLKTANLTLPNRKGFVLLDYAIVNPDPEILKVLLQNIPKDLLSKVMDGNIKSTIVEGYIPTEDSHFPIFFAIALKKEKHAAILLQYDKENYERFEDNKIITNLKTNKEQEVPFNLLFIALKHKLFEFAKILLESEQEILKLNGYRGKFYKDKLEGNFPAKDDHQLSSIIGIYNKSELEKLLKLCIDCEVDISKVPVSLGEKEAKCTLFEYYLDREQNILIKLLPDNPEKLQQIVADPEVRVICNVLLQEQRKKKAAIVKAIALAQQLKPFKNSSEETHNNQGVVTPKKSSSQSFSKK